MTDLVKMQARSATETDRFIQVIHCRDIFLAPKLDILLTPVAVVWWPTKKPRHAAMRHGNFDVINLCHYRTVMYVRRPRTTLMPTAAAPLDATLDHAWAMAHFSTGVSAAASPASYCSLPVCAVIYFLGK